MSSPTGSINEAEDGALNKKRGRAQSQEPVALVKEDEQVEEKSTTVSAPKKTKRDEEASTVSTIRKNMKDMTTTDKVSEGSTSHDGDEQMGAIDEEEAENDDIEEDQEPTTTSALAQFGGNSKDNDDWGEFAQDEEEEEAEKPKQDLNTSKYTFGASSGFGTKGWAASHQTMPTPSKPTFGGFGSSSGFGGFKPTPSPFAVNNSDTKSIPSFSSFAKATTSPFAAAAAATGSNALSPSSTSVTSPNASVEDNKESDDENDHESNNGADRLANTPSSTATFGEAAKVKVPGVKETKVATGEENEDTICQTKGKLYVLDDAQNWKERGVGTFRLNKHDNESRLVMRTDSVYRLILNLKLFPGMKVFIMQEKFIRFGTLQTETNMDGKSETKLVNYALKLSSANTAQEICQHITSCIPSPPSSPSPSNES